jgi:hypothetical protein
VASNLELLALVRLGTGAPEDAEPLLREALRIRQATLPENHWRAAVTQGRLGECLAALKRHTEAEPLLIRSLEILRGNRGIEDAETVAALGRVIAFYESSGDPEKAGEYRAILPAGP